MSRRALRTAIGVLAATAVTFLASPAPPASAAGITVSVYSNPTVTVPGQTVWLDAYAYSSGCSITKYAWSFGDGKAQSGPSLSYVNTSYSSVGSKTVTVTVTDNCGNSTTTNTTHTVVANNAPIANFEMTAKSTDPLSFYADPAGSSDTDPIGLEYFEWSWGDGTYSGSYVYENGGIATHTYAKAGTYTVTMRAYDEHYNASSPVTRTVTAGVKPDPCTIRGTAANDVLTGTTGDDVICGLAGNDVIKGQGGNDTIVGGLGKDKVSYADATTGVTVNLAAGTATGQGSDTLQEIEDVDGSNYADRLVGDGAVNGLAGKGGNDTVDGSAGNDQVWGGDASDTLIGGVGDDRMDGGLGADTVKYYNPVTLDLATGKGTGPGGSDTVVAIENMIGSKYADRITGSSVANNIQGDGGNDTLVGGGAADRISGGAGNDALTGGLGTDYCDGGAGTDTNSTCETKVAFP